MHLRQVLLARVRVHHLHLQAVGQDLLGFTSHKRLRKQHLDLGVHLFAHVREGFRLHI